MTSQAQHDPFFKPIGEHVGEGEDGSEEQLLMTTDENGEQRMVEEIESLCLECHQQGTTRLLMTYIPYFREVIVVSFFCPHCGNRNNEIQSAGQIQPKGCIYTIHVTNVEDLNRQVVKSEHATITIPEIQLTIPNKRGQLTTVEGVLSDTLRDLELGQPLRKHTQPEVHDRIQSICDRLRKILGEEKVVQAEGEDKEEEAVPDNNGLRSHGPVGGSYELQDKDEKRTFAPITMKMDDPSGNSFVEFMGAIEGKGMSDAKWSKRDYPRTTEQNTDLGLGLQEQPTAQEDAEKDTREGGIGTKGGSSAVEEGRESKRSKGPDGGAVPTAMASRQEAEKEALWRRIQQGSRRDRIHQ